MVAYKVGETYRIVDADKLWHQAHLKAKSGDTFTCKFVDADGDCWTEGLTYMGNPDGVWCVGLNRLVSGLVVEAKD